jgi:glutaredoxin-related protein
MLVYYLADILNVGDRHYTYLRIRFKQGVPQQKMQTYNCLEDQELREGIKEFS